MFSFSFYIFLSLLSLFFLGHFISPPSSLISVKYFFLQRKEWNEMNMSRKPCLLWKVLSRALLPASALLRKFLLHPVVLHPPALQVLQRLLHLDPLLPLGVLRHHRLLDLHQFVVVEIPTIRLVNTTKMFWLLSSCWRRLTGWGEAGRCSPPLPCAGQSPPGTGRSHLRI